MKRLSLLLFISCILLLLPELALASGDSASDWSYVNAADGVEIRGYDGPDVEHLEIPATLGGYPVVGLGKRSLWVCKMTSVTIPESIHYISERAFEGCHNLNSVTIPKSVLSVGEGSFSECEKLASIIVEQGNPNYLIANSSLIDKDNRVIIAYPAGLAEKEYNIPDGVIRIGDWTFNDCNELKSITIPNSVTVIGQGAFYDCDNLESAVLSEKLTNIESWAFQQCQKLTTLVIPSAVTHIGEQAFYWCNNLISISIPASVQEIGAGALGGTSNLESIELDEKNEHYEWLDQAIVEKATRKMIAFPCGYTASEYIIPEGIQSIGSDTFRAAHGIDMLIISNDVKSLDDEAFGAADFIHVLMADSVVEMGEAVFQYGDFESIRLSAGLREIKKDSFFNNNALKSIEIPRGIVSIGESAFAACGSLEDVIISDTVKTIEAYAFSRCPNLVRALIPSSVKQIGADAFESCPEKLVLMGTEGGYAQTYTQENNLTFQAVYNKDGYPIGLVTEEHGNELSITGYNGRLRSLIIPSSVQDVPITEISDWAFYWNSEITSVTLPQSINNIGELAFAGCEQLQRVTVEDGVQYIGKQAFAFCPALEEIHLPSSVVSIDADTFEGCSGSLVIFGLQSSYVQAYAQEFAIKYKVLSADEMVAELSRHTAQEGQELKAIIIVPGIMGSELTDYRDSMVYWVGGLTGAPEFLQFEADGTPAYPYISAWRNGADNDYGVLGIYTKLVNSIKEKFGSEYDVQFFSYDWRYGNAATSGKLEKVINQMDYDSVIFVAHSMGGIVVSDYIRKVENKEKIDKVITLGTPFLGSPKALSALESGTLFFNLTDNITSQSVKNMAKNFPSIYELIPFSGFIDVDVPVDNKYTTMPLYSYQQTIDFLKNQRAEFNDALIDQAQDFHSKLIATDHIIKTLGNRLYCIYGTGFDTPEKLIYKYSSDWVSVDWQNAIDNTNAVEDLWTHIQPGGVSLYDISTSTYGDGTVLRHSATIYNTIEQAYEYKVEHKALVSDDEVIKRIISIIDDKPLLLTLPYPPTDVTGLGNDVNHAAFLYSNKVLIYENYGDIYISSFEDFINHQNQKLLYNVQSWPNPGIVGSGDFIYYFDDDLLNKTEITTGVTTVIHKDIHPFWNNLYIDGNRLYFTTDPYGNNDTMVDNIYYINTDGTGLTKLSGASALEMTISDGWIYY